MVFVVVGPVGSCGLPRRESSVRGPSRVTRVAERVAARDSCGTGPQSHPQGGTEPGTAGCRRGAASVGTEPGTPGAAALPLPSVSRAGPGTWVAAALPPASLFRRAEAGPGKVVARRLHSSPGDQEHKHEHQEAKQASKRSQKKCATPCQFEGVCVKKEQTARGRGDLGARVRGIVTAKAREKGRRKSTVATLKGCRPASATDGWPGHENRSFPQVLALPLRGSGPPAGPWQQEKPRQEGKPAFHFQVKSLIAQAVKNNGLRESGLEPS